MPNTITSFTPGDLVVSISGDGDGSGTYGDNQASPITLEELTTSGVVVGTLVLPQTASTNATGASENAISGEYGSSSEGTLELSTDGQSLTIAGYGINANTYNSAEAGYTKTTGPYGSNALAQTTSLSNSTTAIPVPRVIADINYNGVVDTSTALYNVDNTNNPRSVVTNNGSSFYLSGQGVSGDKTQGVALATDGASSATPIDTANDTRTVAISNGTLYVSSDSKQGTGGTSNIAAFNGEPTSAATPTPLPGISQTTVLANGNGNAVNGSTGTVHLSPENFFFATPTTLYVADSGNPKQGGIGDGGLQKWTLANGTWSLAYTVSVPGQVADTASSGTTGLLGLTGKVSGNTVSLYATNATIGDTDPTYLYGISDPLNATTAANTSITQLAAAAPDTNIRGVAFAPSAAVVCFGSGTLIRTADGGMIKDVAVEDLAVGDLAVTASGALRPIRWIGHRVVDCAAAPAPFDTWPVRVRRGAFGSGACGSLPARDLFLSPGHPVLVGADADNEGGVLVPIMCLINGTSVARLPAERVTYWHVELDTHDILLAEGLPAESFLDHGNRPWFGAAAAHALSNPDFVVPDLGGRCRPVAIDGVLVERERRRLDAAFAAGLAAHCAWPAHEAETFT